MNKVPYFEPDPMVPLEIEDPEVAELVLLTARQRGMDPSDYVGVLADCDRRGVKPLWRHRYP